jgi:rhomboid protease GluP
MPESPCADGVIRMVPSPRSLCRSAPPDSAAPSEVLTPPSETLIRAHSERQAMDWALVLASQGIETVIDREAPGRSWVLRMSAQDHARALRSIQQYRIENRRFGWRQPLPGSDWSYHWGVTAWMAVCAVVFYFQPKLERGLFDSAAVRQGEWWRAVTSVWLHQDLGHLGMNLVFGGLFLGLAMGRYGAGFALLTGMLAGALGNLFGLFLRPENYVGLGASGLVMGALGMLAAQAVPLWRAGRWGARLASTTLCAGVGLFIVLGTDPSSDVIAHGGGFVGGLLGGAIGALIPDRIRPVVSRLAGIAAIVLVTVTWRYVLVGSK